MKRCSQCERELEASAFCRNRAAKDGLQSRCRECVAAYTRAYYRANKERLNAYHTEWYRGTREVRPRVRYPDLVGVKAVSPSAYNIEYKRRRRAEGAPW